MTNYLGSWRGLVHLGRATGLFALARVTSQAGWFVATLLVARHLGPGPFGRYALLLAAAAIIVNGLGTGLPVLALREAAAGNMTKELARRLAATLLCVTGLGVCITAAFGMYMGGFPLGPLEGALAGGYFCMVCLVGLGSSLQTGHDRFVTAAIGEALVGVCVPAATWLALASGGHLLGTLIAIVVAPLPAIAWLFLRLPEMGGCSRPQYVGLFRKSLSFVALGLASGGYARVDTVLLSVVASPATVGLYAAAYRLMGPLQLFLSAFGTVFFSRVSRARGVGGDWRHLNRRGQVVLLIVLIPLVVVGVVVAPLAVRLLFGPSYVDAALPARILLITMIPVAWSWPSGHTLNAFDRQHIWILVLLAGILLDAVLVLSLGHALGATGAAIAWLVVEAATVGWVGIGMRHISSSRRTAVAREFDAGPSAVTSDPLRPS